jgi:hypothetical protein
MWLTDSEQIKVLQEMANTTTNRWNNFKREVVEVNEATREDIRKFVASLDAERVEGRKVRAEAKRSVLQFLTNIGWLKR